MELLRLTPNQKDKIMRSIRDKLELDCKGSISKFEITKNDVKEYIKDFTKNEIVKPSLFITAEAYVKMLELVRQSSVEISWHGLVKRNETKDIYLLYDILVFPQINGPTTTTTDEKDFAEWQTKLIMDTEFPIEDLRMHGHSHVNFGVFSSAVDDGYQKDLIQKVEDGDYYIFMVFNKKMEICTLIYDFNQNILFTGSDINVCILSENKNTVLQDWATKQIEDKCTTAIPKTPPYAFYGRTGIYDTTNDDDLPVKPKKGKKHGSK